MRKNLTRRQFLTSTAAVAAPLIVPASVFGTQDKAAPPTLRDVIRWAIAGGLQSYCSGPLNYDPKLHLGCQLVPLDLYVMHTRAFFNPIFRRALKYLEPTRHDPILRRFPNADEL